MGLFARLSAWWVEHHGDSVTGLENQGLMFKSESQPPPGITTPRSFEEINQADRMSPSLSFRHEKMDNENVRHIHLYLIDHLNWINCSM
jgi:hypothetical protein